MLESGSFTPAGECSPAYSLPPAFQCPYNVVQDGAVPQLRERRYRINRLKVRGQTTATGTGLPSLRAGSQAGQLSKNSSTA